MKELDEINRGIADVNRRIASSRQGPAQRRGIDYTLVLAIAVLFVFTGIYVLQGRMSGLTIIGEIEGGTQEGIVNETPGETPDATGNTTAAPGAEAVAPDEPKVVITDSNSREIDHSDKASVLASGAYDVEVTPSMNPVQKMKLRGVNSSRQVDIGLEKVRPAEGNWKQMYAVDLSRSGVDSAELTAVAEGNMLFKCREWNFTEQRCDGAWEKLMDITPGEEYTIHLSPTDPGFGEMGIDTYYMFQANDTQYTTYRQLLNQTVGVTQYTSATVSLSTTGVKCWADRWLSQNWTQRTAVNGTWNFTVYGACDTAQATGYIFARMLKRNASGEYNFQNTTQSGTNICAGGTTISPIISSLAASAYTDILPGERTGVSYCLNVTKLRNGKVANIYWEGGTPSNVRFPTAKYDSTPPNVTLAAPPNQTNTPATLINFTYNVSDANQIANCSLVIDGTVNRTNSSVARNTYQNFSTTFGLGTYEWYVNCTDTAYNTGQSAKRQITITYLAESIPPTWSNNRTRPASPATYNASQQYQFNVTWTDNANVSEVLIEHNFTQTAANYTVSSKNGDEYYYNYPTLAAGTYYWKEYGTDNSTNRNTTDAWQYVVNKAASEVNLLLNGTDSNMTILQGQYVNMTGYLVSGEGYIYMYMNGTPINYGNGPLMNVTQFIQAAEYEIKIEHNATSNYTASNEAHHVIVQADTVQPNVANAAANPSNVGTGSPVNITATVTDNANVAYVAARIAYPNSTTTDYQMTHVGNNVYSYIFTTTLEHPLGQYNVTIIANDSAANTNSTEKTYFTVYDAPPVFNFYSDSPDPVAVNQTITILANVTDNTAVSVVLIQVNGTNYTATRNTTISQVTLSITNTTGDCVFAHGSTAEQANASDNYRPIVEAGITCGWNAADINDPRFASLINVTVYAEHVAETGVTPSSSTLLVGNSTSTSAYGSVVLSTNEGNQNQLENSQGLPVAGEGTDSYVTSSLPPGVAGFNNMQVRISNNDAGGSDTRAPDYIYIVVNYNAYTDVWYRDFNTTGLAAGYHNYTIYANDTYGQVSNANGSFKVDYVTRPTANITSPASGSAFSQGYDINFTGWSYDLEDGNLTGAKLVWYSSRDGKIGTGSPLAFATLSPGNHTINLTATDSYGLVGWSAINLTITSEACAGMESGWFTLTNITIDGNITDWDAVLQNPHNVINDGVSGVTDPDITQTADKDLRKFGVTWDEEWVWMYIRRSSGGKNVIGLDTYFDFDQDSLLETSDRVLVIDWGGSNRMYDSSLFNYTPVNSSGDPVTGDGIDEPGTVSNEVPIESNVMGGSEEGIEIEYRVRWSELGLSACTPIIAHISSAIGSGKNVPSQVEDNMASFDTRIYGMTFYADNIKSGKQGTTVTYQHTIRNLGNLPDLFNLNLSGTMPGYTVSVFFANGTTLTDSDADGRIDTGYILPSYGVTIHVNISIPLSAVSGDVDTTTIRAYSKIHNGTNGTVTDTTIVGAIAVIPSHTGLATANSTIDYTHYIYNNDITAVVNVYASSNQGYTTKVYYQNGTQLTDTNSDSIPDIGYLAGGTYLPILVRVEIPAPAAIGTVDNTTVTANSTFGETGWAYDATTVSRYLDITPNITKAAGQGTFTYLLHTITYVSSQSGVVDIQYNQTQAYVLSLYYDDYSTPLTDTDMDGIIDAGTFQPNGDTKTIVAKLRIPDTAAINTTDIIHYNATTNASQYFGSARDNVSVQKLVSYSDPAHNTQSYQFRQTETIYAQAYALDMAQVYFQWVDANSSVARLSPYLPVDMLRMADDNYYVNASDLSGEWTLIIYNRQGSTEITRINFRVNTPPVVLFANYTPAEAYEGDMVNFTANITAGELKWFPNETVVMGALLELAGKNYSMGGPGTMSGIGSYNFTLDTANITGGTYTYKIWAYDNFTFYNVSAPWTGQIVIKPYNFTNVSGYITNTTYGIVPSTLFVRNSTGHLVWTDDENYSFKLFRGDKYDVTIIPSSGAIKEITYINVTFPTIMPNFTRMEDSHENDTDKPDEIKAWTEAITWWTSPSFYYARTRINFTYGSGTGLYFWKCNDWNFDYRNCTGNNFQVIQNLSDGPGWAMIDLAPGDPGAGAGKAPDYNESLKVWDVTGLNETERRDNGTFVGEFYDLQGVNFTLNKAYRIEVFVTQTVLDAVGILRDPYYDNIQDDWQIDIAGGDAPNITVINGTVAIDPLNIILDTGTEPGTNKLIWDSDPPNKTVSDMDQNDTAKLWFVVDILANASPESHLGHFVGKSKGHDAEITNNLTTLVGMPPCTVNLTFPNNGNDTLINRTLTFLWQQACDPDNQTLTYSINISSELCSDIYDTNISSANYTSIYELGTYDECGTYNWSVRAYDGYYYGNWSDSWNFSIRPYVALFLVNDTVDFGNADTGETNDTTDNNPYPFLIQSDGNVFTNVVNVTANQSFFTGGTARDDDFQLKVDNSTEIGAFNWTGSATSWINVTTMQMIISSLEWHDSNDTAEIDVKVHVPIDEPPGLKITGLVFYGEQR